jgi:hypothetical protein
MFMKIPKGFTVNTEDSEEYVLRMKKNYYRLKQAGQVWNKHLVSKLTECGLTQNKYGKCLFYRGLYTNNSILAGPDPEELEQIKRNMTNAGLNLTSSKPGVSDFLGVKIDQQGDNIHFTQPHLIDSILEDSRINIDRVATKQTPALMTKGLCRHLDSQPFDQHFSINWSLVCSITWRSQHNPTLHLQYISVPVSLPIQRWNMKKRSSGLVNIS